MKSIKKMTLGCVIFLFNLTLIGCNGKEVQHIEQSGVDSSQIVNQADDIDTIQDDIFSSDVELFSNQVLFANDFLLYSVNCGTTDTSRHLDGEKMGLYQSVTDMPYGIDPDSKTKWGYEKKDYMIATGDNQSVDWLDTKWEIDSDYDYESDTTGFYYHFQLPLPRDGWSGVYEITCGFYDPFSARTVDIVAEDEIVKQDEKLLKYKETSVSFHQEVTDGELNIKVYNPKRGKDAMKNPILSYITVKAVPEYNDEYLALLLQKTEMKEEDMIYYRADTAERYMEAKKRAEQARKENKLEREEYEERYMNLEKAFENLEKLPCYEAFYPGEIWLDSDGAAIQAHGGHVQRLTVKDEEAGEMSEKWWWVGEDKTHGYRGGIKAYSSDDLYNWKSEGIVMRNVTSREELETDTYFQELYADYTKEQLDRVYQCINNSTSVIERPKMIFNKKTGKYLMWFHADGPTDESNANYAAASAGLAISDTPNGPFRFVDRYRLNVCPPDQEDMYPQSKGMARDMNLFVDDDGTGYIIYSSEENLTIYISKLNEEYDYLCTDPAVAVYGVDYVRLYPGAQREAPAIIKKDGYYYMMTSGATGWDPNQARYWRATDILGEWEDMGDPCIDDVHKDTFASQSTCIFQADGDTYIYMGDRWKSENLGDSRYIWLPIVFDERGEMKIEWVDTWSIQSNH